VRRVNIGLFLVVSLSLGLLGTAGADKRSVDDSASDASPNSVDLVRAKVSHTDDGRLRHTITVDGQLNTDNDRQILLQFNLDGDRGCEREFIWPPVGERNIIECGIGEGDGVGRISKPEPNKLQIVFRKNVLGNPERYGWRVVSRGCPKKCAFIDALPNQDGDNEVYVRHNLN
jgi:hypothetical protein